MRVPRPGSLRELWRSRKSLSPANHCHVVPVGSDHLPSRPISSLTSCVPGSQFPHLSIEDSHTDLVEWSGEVSVKMTKMQDN